MFVEVKERAREGYGGAVGAVDREKRRRVRKAAASWLQAHPETAELEIGFEVAAITDGHLERLDLAGMSGTHVPLQSVQSRGALSPNGRARHNGHRCSQRCSRARRPSQTAGETFG